jgi:hypothetical protein
MRFTRATLLPQRPHADGMNALPIGPQDPEPRVTRTDDGRECLTLKPVQLAECAYE